tara:strand:+ start:336 stop:686 length:351 start_codon:yes stop_codon:yes gene_type:complete
MGNKEKQLDEKVNGELVDGAPLKSKDVTWKIVGADARHLGRSGKSRPRYLLVMHAKVGSGIDRFTRTEEVSRNEYDESPVGSEKDYEMYSANGKTWFFDRETARKVYATINRNRRG